MAKQWKPVEEDYWGYVNVERKGTAISVCLNAELERDNGYLIVPLPDDMRLCHLADVDPAPSVQMTQEVHEALTAAISALWDTQNLKDMEHGDVLFAYVTSLTGGNDGTATE